MAQGKIWAARHGDFLLNSQDRELYALVFEKAGSEEEKVDRIRGIVEGYKHQAEERERNCSFGKSFGNYWHRMGHGF